MLAILWAFALLTLALLVLPLLVLIELFLHLPKVLVSQILLLAQRILQSFSALLPVFTLLRITLGDLHVLQHLLQLV